ncbi:hypothetical protein FSP39_017595 [Pinctada imbricata]|uniref:Beta-lactamase-related domain-containing protein n=1 Tax=Pinctada imbricata TaxID=66713 RepID=A0AA88YA60_PINIB|nr:hypothetical protein FSP39_017595 [Pinctada imbricata]
MALQCHDNPALSVSVVKDNEVRFSQGFGTRKIGTSAETVTERTIFGIASLSKAFAATLIVKLLDEDGRYDIDTPLRVILQNDAIFSDELRSKFTTIRDLLAHRHGIPGNNRIRMDTNLTRANLIGRLKYLSFKGRFRDSFYYSNLMYGVLTHIAEVLGGKTWEELVKEHLFDPLGMTSSTFVTTAKSESLELAHGYFNNYGKMEPVPWELSRRWGLLCGSGCVLSNAKDMTKWMMFHLNKGLGPEGTGIMNESSVTTLHRPQLHLPYSTNYKFKKPEIPVPTTQCSYAMGFRNGHYRGYETLSHTGSMYGYKAMLTLFPSENLGIFTAMTGDDQGYWFRTTLQNYLADIYLNQQPWLNQSTLCSFPEPFFKDTRPKTKPPIEKFRKLARYVSRYAGIYYHPAYKNLKIIPKFPLHMEYGFGKFKLYAMTKKDHFYMEAYDMARYMSSSYGKVIFHASERDKNAIDRIEIPSFQKDDPPIFLKGISTPAAYSKLGHKSTADILLPQFIFIIVSVIVVFVNIFLF